MAPGYNIRSTCPGGQFTQMSGTSFAAAFVTGSLALLWSIFPMASAAELIYSLRTGSSDGSHKINYTIIIKCRKGLLFIKKYY